MLPFSVVLLQQIHCYPIGLLPYYGNASNSLLCNSNHHVTIATLPKSWHVTISCLKQRLLGCWFSSSDRFWGSLVEIALKLEYVNYCSTDGSYKQLWHKFYSKVAIHFISYLTCQRYPFFILHRSCKCTFFLIIYFYCDSFCLPFSL
jgi:hypothetical protein